VRRSFFLVDGGFFGSGKFPIGSTPLLGCTRSGTAASLSLWTVLSRSFSCLSFYTVPMSSLFVRRVTGFPPTQGFGPVRCTPLFIFVKGFSGVTYCLKEYAGGATG